MKDMKSPAVRSNPLDPQAARESFKSEKGESKSGAPNKAQEAPWSILIRLLGWSIFLVAIVAGIYGVWARFPAFRPMLVETLTLLALFGVYPATYLAYLRSGAEAKRKRLREDFRLFGLVSDEDLDETINELYRNLYSGPQFIAFIMLIIGISTLVLWSFSNRQIAIDAGLVQPRVLDLVFFGYIGAYVFSVQELIRRYNTFDLQPQVYSSILARILVTVAIAFIFGNILIVNGKQSLEANSEQSALAASALEIAIVFTIGVFPTVGVRWIVQQAQRILSLPGRTSIELPLNNVLGISTWHEARLSVMGVDDAQNLATVDLPRILLTTQFDTPQIANWIDQAILYVKVGAKIDRFREAKITTFSELLTVVEQRPFIAFQNSNSSANQQNNVVNLATLLGLSSYDEFNRILDYSSFPNYNNIAQYYEGAARIGRQRSEISILQLTGAGALDRKFLSQLTIPNEDLDLVVEQQRLKRQRRGIKRNAELSTRLGVISYLLGEKKEAGLYFSEALALDPGYADAFYGRSVVYLDKKDIGSALQDVTKAIELRPGYAEAFNHRGSIYLQQHDYERAIRDLDKAIDLDPRLAVAHYNRAIACNAKNQIRPALQELEKAFLLGYEQAGLWYNWGLVLLGDNKDADAIDKFTRAIFRNPNLTDAYINRGNAYLGLGNLYREQATDDFETALKIDPNEVEPYNKLGNIAFSRQDYQVALDFYQNALSRDANHIYALLNKAKVYIQLKDFENAVNLYKTLNKPAMQGRLDSEQQNEFEQLSEVLGLSDRILKELQQALQLSRSITNNEIGIAYSLRQLGVFFAQRGDLDTARQNLDEAKRIYQQLKQGDHVQELDQLIQRFAAGAADLHE